MANAIEQLRARGLHGISDMLERAAAARKAWIDECMRQVTIDCPDMPQEVLADFKVYFDHLYDTDGWALPSQQPVESSFEPHPELPQVTAESEVSRD